MLEQKDQIRYVLAGIVTLSIAYAAFQYGQSVNDAYSSRTFTVEGSAKIQTANDVATFTATVTTEGGMDQAAVQNENSEAMNKAVGYLEANGIAKEDMKTENYNLSPRYSNPNCFGGRCEESKIIGYTATQNVNVKVREAAKAGELVGGVVQNGATSVSQVSFEVDDNKEAIETAKTEALRDAEQQARRLAKAGNFHLGKMVTFYEQGYPGIPYPMGGVATDMATMEKASAAPAPRLEPGSTNDEVRITVTYEIQ